MSDIPLEQNLTPPSDFSLENTMTLFGTAGATAGSFKGEELFAKKLRDYYIHSFFADGNSAKNFYIDSTASFSQFVQEGRIQLVIDPSDGVECYGFPNGSTLLVKKTLEGILVDKPITNVPNPLDPTALNGFGIIARDFGPSKAILIALHEGSAGINNAFIRLKDINTGFAPLLFTESMVLVSSRCLGFFEKLAMQVPPTQWGYDYPNNPNTPPVNVKANTIAISCQNSNYPALNAPHPASLCFLWESIIQGFDKAGFISGFDFTYIRESAIYLCNNGLEIENTLLDIISLKYASGLSNGSVVKTGNNIPQFQFQNLITELNPSESVYYIQDSANLKLGKISAALITPSSTNSYSNLENQHFNSLGLDQKDPRVIVTNCSPALSSEIILKGTQNTNQVVTHTSNTFMSYIGTIIPDELERFEQVGTGANTRYYYRGTDPKLIKVNFIVYGQNASSVASFKLAIGLNTLDKNHNNNNLAGTISYTNNNNIVTGVGTAFLTDFDKKNEIVDVTNNVTRTVKSVISNTQLEVTNNFVSNASGASYRSGVYAFLNKITSLINFASSGQGQLTSSWSYRMSQDDYLKLYTFTSGTNNFTVNSLQFFAEGNI